MLTESSPMILLCLNLTQGNNIIYILLESGLRSIVFYTMSKFWSIVYIKSFILQYYVTDFGMGNDLQTVHLLSSQYCKLTLQYYSFQVLEMEENPTCYQTVTPIHPLHPVSLLLFLMLPCLPLEEWKPFHAKVTHLVSSKILHGL